MQLDSLHATASGSGSSGKLYSYLSNRKPVAVWCPDLPALGLIWRHVPNRARQSQLGVLGTCVLLRPMSLQGRSSLGQEGRIPTVSVPGDLSCRERGYPANLPF